MQFQVKLIIFTYLKTEDSLASKVHFCGLDLQTTSFCVGGAWAWINVLLVMDCVMRLASPTHKNNPCSPMSPQ